MQCNVLCLVRNYLNTDLNIMFVDIAVLIWSSDFELETVVNYLQPFVLYPL